MRWLYTKAYDYGRWMFALREVHGFVLNKASRIARHLCVLGVVEAHEFVSPKPRGFDELRAFHRDEVVDGLHEGEVVAQAAEFDLLARMPGFLRWWWIVRPQLRACHGTVQAMAWAAEGAWVCNLSGGFHHARPDLSHGFCLVNDVAWGIWALREEKKSPKVLILDLDLHQGDGNHAMFRDESEIMSVSLHQEQAFPFPKVPGDLDVGLPLGLADRGYFEILDETLAQVADEFEPELIIYLAGSDPYVGDQLGSLCLSREGLIERDRKVGEFARTQGAGLVMLTAGGYASESPEIFAEGAAAIAALAPKG